MTTTRLTPIDCKVPVRKWVLISEPSRWSQKNPRARVIVYSPMLSIPEEASHIPVKRFSRDAEDTVCSLPVADIEKDSSKIYDELRVKRASSFVHAHGVAIVDGPDDGISFSRGHRFWIHVGCKTENYEKLGIVPVTNLETFQEGIISAKHVCWFPKIRGPNGTFWTPGGQIRKLKLYGSKKYSYWSFAIRQKLDGTSPIVEVVQIPGKNSIVQDIQELVAADREPIFVQRYKSLEPKCSGELPTPKSPLSISSSSPTDASRDPSSAVLPPNDFTEHEAIPVDGSKVYSPIINTVDIRNNLAGSNRRRAYRKNPPSQRHSSKITSSRRRRYTRRLSIDSNGNSDNKPPFSDASLITSCSPQRKLSTLEAADGCLENSDILEDVDFCMNVLMEIRRDLPSGTSSSGYAKSFIGHFMGNTLNEIREQYNEEQRDLAGRAVAIRKAQNTHLCDHSDPDCDYTTLHAAKHYHSPVDKCITGSLHEHCIYLSRPLPGRRGDCLVRLKRPLHHLCCYWGISQSLPMSSGYDQCELKETVENGMPVYDLSGSGYLEEAYPSHDEFQLMEEDPYLLGGPVYDLGSVDEVDIGDMLFYPPFLAGMGVDSDGFVGVSEWDVGRVGHGAA